MLAEGFSPPTSTYHTASAIFLGATAPSCNQSRRPSYTYRRDLGWRYLIVPEGSVFTGPGPVSGDGLRYAVTKFMIRFDWPLDKNKITVLRYGFLVLRYGKTYRKYCTGSIF